MALDGLRFYPGCVRLRSKKSFRRPAFLFPILSCCARVLGMVSYHFLVRGQFSGRGEKFKAKQVSRVLTIFWRVRATRNPIHLRKANTHCSLETPQDPKQSKRSGPEERH
jgi:hypothetical protein